MVQPLGMPLKLQTTITFYLKDLFISGDYVAVRQMSAGGCFCWRVFTAAIPPTKPPTTHSN